MSLLVTFISLSISSAWYPCFSKRGPHAVTTPRRTYPLPLSTSGCTVHDSIAPAHCVITCNLHRATKTTPNTSSPPCKLTSYPRTTPFCRLTHSPRQALTVSQPIKTPIKPWTATASRKAIGRYYQEHQANVKSPLCTVLSVPCIKADSSPCKKQTTRNEIPFPRDRMFACTSGSHLRVLGPLHPALEPRMWYSILATCEGYVRRGGTG